MIRAIIAPLVGGAIGYITNDLAIRMLFRPRQAIYIGKFHVPFTPGLIPSQQGRIAVSIGDVISNQLLNEESLRQTLLSEQTLNTLRDKVRKGLHALSEDQRKVRELVRKGSVREKINMSADDLQQKLTNIVCERINEAKLGYTILDSVVWSRMDNITQNKLFNRIVDGAVQESIKEKMAEKVDEIIADNAPGAVSAMIGKYRAEVLDMRVCDIYARYQDREDMLIDRLTDLYVSILSNNLDKLLKAINIRQIVIDKINSLDPADLEKLIFDIARSELRAIVLLGALLGFIMGFVNLLL